MNQEYDANTDYRSILAPMFAEQDNSAVLERVDNVINSMGERLDYNKVYYEMYQSDFNAMVDYIKESTDDQLVRDIKNIFGA